MATECTAELVHLFGTLNMEVEQSPITHTRIIEPKHLVAFSEHSPTYLRFTKAAIGRKKTGFTVQSATGQYIRMQTDLQKFRGIRLIWDSFYNASSMELWQIPRLELIDAHLVSFTNVTRQLRQQVSPTELAISWLEAIMPLFNIYPEKVCLREPVVCCFGTDTMSNPLVKINRTKRLMYRQDYDSEIQASLDALNQYHQETIQYNPLAF